MIGLCGRLFLLVSFFVVCQPAIGQSTISRYPASIPLVVRSPYFNSWLPTLNNASTLPEAGGVWPTLWHSQVGGWIGFIRVDGNTYQWLGVGGVDLATMLSVSITPTQTVFRMRAGPVDFTVTFLSPVEASDWSRQSFPFSYVAIDVASKEGGQHSVQVYVDVTGEWVSPSLDDTTQTTTFRGKSILYNTLQRSNRSTVGLVEERNVALDATLILAVTNTNAVTSQTGPSSDIRSYFDANGRLTNAVDESDIPIAPSYPVISVAIDVGNVSSTSSPTPLVFALGILRDPVVQYGNDLRRPYFFTKWSTVEEALDDFLSDFPTALSRANDLDSKIMSDARADGQAQYADLVALSLRQTLASIDITTSEKLDPGDVKAFMKDVGESSRANPVDTMYASLPALLYLNASLVGALLDPLFSSSSAHGFAAPDLGSKYPAAASNTSDSTIALGVDSCASMLIMSLTHAQKSGEGFLLNHYYDALKKWADFLVENALRPSVFVTSDGRTETNNSNLALKGILGIYAMGQINKALESQGKSSVDTTFYNEKALDYYGQWKTLGFPAGHMISNYGQGQSWSFGYNFYLAKLLKAEFVSSQIYDDQTAFHATQIASNEDNFGIGYDSNAQYTMKSHWTMFTAATVTDDAVRNALISGIYNRTFLTLITPPFATTWDARSGATLDGIASPAQGAMFALLALKVPDVSIQFSSTRGSGNGNATSASTSQLNVGAIVGGALGGLVVVMLIVLVAIVLRRRRRQKEEEKTPQPPPQPPTLDNTTVTDTTPTTTATTFIFPSTVFTKSAFPSSPSNVSTPYTPSSAQALASPMTDIGGGGTTITATGLASGSSTYSGGDENTNSSRRGSTTKSQLSPPSQSAERSASDSGGGNETEELRVEMLALRREVEEIRARTTLQHGQQGNSEEPPPSYSS